MINLAKKHFKTALRKNVFVDFRFSKWYNYIVNEKVYIFFESFSKTFSENAY